MDNLQKTLLAIVMLALSGTYAFSATAGVYVFPGGDKATLSVTAPKPTKGEYNTSWSDGTGSSGTASATPSGTKSGDVETAPPQTTSGKNGKGEPVKGDTYRVHKGKAQKKDSKGRWRTGKLLPKKNKKGKGKGEGAGGAGAPQATGGGAGTAGTLPASQGTGGPGLPLANRECIGTVPKR